MTKIDTETRHRTKPGANIFEELGFGKAEAKALKADLDSEINAARAVKVQLMDELTAWISANHYKQYEAAEILKVARPRVTDVVNKKTSKFTVDMLITLLARAGKEVHLTVG
ncbi:helix-turn-helix domain-containing protein [Caballeronia sp. TF1N1]|uniref:helix-turn-helix domain-containing protein n=1 Tax=Caballeronia sp. TF1N1 TaxID=2878153 RepID=UPI001FD0FE0C|nr:XRE family transcriptional regulator [Caballeronia sp. TF1N1]